MHTKTKDKGNEMKFRSADHLIRRKDRNKEKMRILWIVS